MNLVLLTEGSQRGLSKVVWFGWCHGFLGWWGNLDTLFQQVLPQRHQITMLTQVILEVFPCHFRDICSSDLDIAVSLEIALFGHFFARLFREFTHFRKWLCHQGRSLQKQGLWALLDSGRLHGHLKTCLIKILLLSLGFFNQFLVFHWWFPPRSLHRNLIF